MSYTLTDKEIEDAAEIAIPYNPNSPTVQYYRDQWIKGAKYVRDEILKKT